MDNKKIRQLNDNFRKTFVGWDLIITAWLRALWPLVLFKVMDVVMQFDDFNEDNDPYGEHDFWRFEVDWKAFYFKIDYYDKSMEFGSPDPSDPSVTVRVLTMMLTSEY